MSQEVTGLLWLMMERESSILIPTVFLHPWQPFLDIKPCTQLFPFNLYIQMLVDSTVFTISHNGLWETPCLKYYIFYHV